VGLIWGAVENPLSGTTTASFAGDASMSRFADRVPVSLGSNSNAILQLAPGASASL